MPTNRFRPWIAAAFAFLYPGLGHVYLRAWLRAVAWFGLAMAVAWLVVPADYLAVVQQNGLRGILTASESLPLTTVAPLLVVRALNVVDAYRTAIWQPAPDEHEGDRCPHCNEPLDDDLDFCHWCTTRLDADESDENEIEIVS